MLDRDKLEKKRMLRETNAYLVALLGDRNVEEWWQRKNSHFLGKTPAEAWEENPVKVYQYVASAGDGYW